MKKITIIYSGHQIDYLYGLLSGFNNKNHIRVEVIDAVRDEPEIKCSNKILIYKFLDWRSIIKTKYSLFFISWVKYYYRLFNHIRQTDSEVIHIEWINKYFSFFEETFLTYLYKKYDKRIVFKVHDIDSNLLLNSKGNFNLKLGCSKKYFYKKIDKFIVHNKFVKNILVSNGVNQNKISVIPHGINNYVNFQNCSKLESRIFFNLPNDAKVILFFGNISPYKDLESLLELFYNNKISSNTYLIIAGKFRRGLNKYKRKILDLIHKSDNSDRILFHNHFIDSNDIEKYFVASDILCLPYKFIFQSGVLFLSYSMGLPVLARNVGGIAEDIEEGVTGHIYNHQSDLNNALQLAFKNKNLKKGMLLREYCKTRYDWSNIVDDTIKTYSDQSGK